MILMRSHTLIVFKKEIKDMLRDKKTVIVSVLIPLLIFPIMYGLMGYASKQNSDSANNDIKISVIGSKQSSIYLLLKSDKKIKILNEANTDTALKDGKIDVIVNIPKDVDQNIKNQKTANIKIKQDNLSTKSSMVAEKISNMIGNGYSKQIVSNRLKSKGINPNILQPINIVSENLKRENNKDNSGEIKVFLAMIIPLFLIIYSATSPMAVAIDSGAGEKERGTLEPLLSTCANRTSLLWGKCFAIMVIGVLGVASSLAGLGISMVMVKGMLKDQFGNIGKVGLDPMSIVIILALALVLTMIFGAVELAISVYARSFKEAQTYLSPVSIIVMIPAFLTYMMDVKSITFVYFNIPIANVSCLMKEVIYGIYNPVHFGVVIAWMLVYVAIAIGSARYMFSREQVVFRT